MRLSPIFALPLVLACTTQQRAQSARAAAVFECEVAVLAPYVPDAVDAAELVRDVVTGKVELPLALARMGAPLEEINRAVSDFNLCFAGAGEELRPPAPAPLPEGETSLRAPPPAYGNRWL